MRVAVVVVAVEAAVVVVVVDFVVNVVALVAACSRFSSAVVWFCLRSRGQALGCVLIIYSFVRFICVGVIVCVCVSAGGLLTKSCTVTN